MSTTSPSPDNRRNSGEQQNVNQSEGSVKSSRSGVRRANLNFEYTPDPPIPKQIKSLNRYLGKLTNMHEYFANLVTQDTQNSVDYRPGSSESIKILNQFQDIADKMENGIIKLFDDLFRCYKTPTRQKNKEQAQSAIETVKSVLPEFNDMFDQLRTILFGFICVGLSTIDDTQIPVELIERMGDFHRKFAKAFIEQTWNICQYAITNKDLETYQSLRKVFVSRVFMYDNDLNRLVQSVAENINRMKITDSQMTAEFKKQIYDDLMQVNNTIGFPFLECVEKSRACVFPIIQEYYLNDDQHLVDPKDNSDDDKSDQEKDPPTRSHESIPMLFDKRLDHLDQLTYKLHGLELKNNEEEDFDELADEIEPDAAVSKFIIKAIEKENSSLLEEMELMWLDAYNQNNDAQLNQYGVLISDQTSLRLEDHDPSLSLVTVARLYKKSIQYHDKETNNNLIRVFVKHIEEELAKIDKLRSRQLKLLNGIPEKFPKENEEEDDLELQYENAIAQIKEKADITAEKLDDLTAKLTETLRESCEAVFIYVRRGEELTPHKVENEEPIDETRIFTDFEVRYNEGTHDHLDFLQKMITNTYENAIVRDQNKSTNVDPEGRSIKDGKSVSDTKSVVSKAVKKAAKSNAERKKLGEILNLTDKLQIGLTEEAIVRTYEQLFASMRNLITNAIRELDGEAAEEMNNQLHKLYVPYMNHLKELKKLCIESMDVRATKDVEARIEKDQTCNSQEIIKCLETCLVDVVEQTIENYFDNIASIKDEFDDKEEKCRQELDRRFGELERNEHLAALVLLEKQLKVELCREEQRPVASLTALEDIVKRKLAENDFEGAQREKKKLAAARKKDIEERKNATIKKYEKLRKQKMDLQLRDLQNLEQLFDRKLTTLSQERDDQLKEQQNMFVSSVRASTQRISLLTSRLVSQDPHLRKDYANKYDSIVNGVLKSHDLLGLM